MGIARMLNERGFDNPSQLSMNLNASVPSSVMSTPRNSPSEGSPPDDSTLPGFFSDIQDDLWEGTFSFISNAKLQT
jgi:hypothetical protein